MTTDSKLFRKIIDLLEKSKTPYEITEHEPVFTSEQAAKIRGATLQQGAKALVFFADKNPIMIVVPADRKLSFSKAKKNLGIKDLRMAKPEEVLNLLGVEIGAVPPFGSLEGLKLYVDKHLGENSHIFFNPGVHTKSIKLGYTDFENIAKPIVSDLAED